MQKFTATKESLVDEIEESDEFCESSPSRLIRKLHKLHSTVNLQFVTVLNCKLTTKIKAANNRPPPYHLTLIF